jgi:carotenoid cleavage dioxygenase-like enzyme
MLQVQADGNTKVVGELPVTEPAYLHSFGMSPNYLIIAEFPLVVYPLKLLFQLKPFIENFKWKPKRGTTFYVMDRNSGKLVKKYTTDAFFAFHHINAFEKDNELILDIDAYENDDIISSFYLNRIKDSDLELPYGIIKRYRLNLNGDDKIKDEILADECIEMPRFDFDRHHMNQNYRFVYGIGVNKNHPKGFYNQIVKIDIQNGTSKTWFKENCYPSEPVFVPKPDAKTEDDGIIMTIVLDAEKGNSYLLILDAQNFEELGRAEVEQPILIGYHGAYFSNL